MIENWDDDPDKFKQLAQPQHIGDVYNIGDYANIGQRQTWYGEAFLLAGLIVGVVGIIYLACLSNGDKEVLKVGITAVGGITGAAGLGYGFLRFSVNVWFTKQK